MLFYKKNAILYFNFSKSPPGTPRSPYFVQIQDIEYTETFDSIPYLTVK